MISRWLYNILWLFSMQKEKRYFAKALNDVRKTQEQLLANIVSRNQNTEFGRKYSFSTIKSVSDYQKTVPISSYDDYLPLIKRIGDGHKGVLTAERVLLFEPSSGTAAATKYIPYTAELKKDFQRGIYPWLVDTYAANLNLLCGSSYWSITPPNTPVFGTSGNIPVGFEEDISYLGAAAELLLRRIFAVPSEIKQVTDIESFRYITLLFLLKASDLALISVWNPTFLLLLLERLQEWQSLLITDLTSGTINPPKGISPSVRLALENKLGKHPERARELGDLFQNRPEDFYSALWPRLEVISCWADGHAALYAKQVQEMFPLAIIQGKGLLATEGIVTIPYSVAGGNILSVRSHFYEFIDQDDRKIKTAWQLEVGKHYSVVLTTSGGLYRYLLLDLVKVMGFYQQCPLLSFLGKEEKVVDIFGEKLHEHFVANAVSKLIAHYELHPRFYMIAPEEKKAGGTCYVLFAEPADTHERSRWGSLVKALDEMLKENFHYAHCRNLGQLQAVELFIIQRQGAETYLTESRRKGQKLGNIKPVVLHASKGWADKFQGEYF